MTTDRHIARLSCVAGGVSVEPWLSVICLAPLSTLTLIPNPTASLDFYNCKHP